MVALEYPGGWWDDCKMVPRSGVRTSFEAVLRTDEHRKGQVLFQQDRVSRHCAKTIVAYLTSHVIKLFPHPAKSPDMSPIKPIWNTLKKLIHK